MPMPIANTSVAGPGPKTDTRSRPNRTVGNANITSIHLLASAPAIRPDRPAAIPSTTASTDATAKAPSPMASDCRVP